MSPMLRAIARANTHLRLREWDSDVWRIRHVATCRTLADIERAARRMKPRAKTLLRLTMPVLNLPTPRYQLPFPKGTDFIVILGAPTLWVFPSEPPILYGGTTPMNGFERKNDSGLPLGITNGTYGAHP